MTEEEATKVGSIAMEADGGCISCSAGQIESLADAFPEHAGLLKKIWEDEYEQPLERLG